MELLDYIKEHEKSLSDFAKRIGIPQPTLWRIAHKKVRAYGVNAIKIVDGSNGIVSFHDLFS